jgi:hypothetical protein
MVGERELTVAIGDVRHFGRCWTLGIAGVGMMARGWFGARKMGL